MIADPGGRPSRSGVLVYRQHMRRKVSVLVVGAVAVAAGCSGSESIDAPLVTVADAILAPTSSLASERDPAGDTRIAEPASMPTLRVDMKIEVESSGLQAELGAEVDPAALDLADPFGTFASCSGGRRAFGPYSVLVSVPGGEVLAASVFTAESVTRAGIYDADVRIEPRSGDAQSATGTVTIDVGWRSGTFLAFGLDGGAITGSFECAGGDPSPSPLDTSATAGVVDSVQVVALLRQEGAERVVGLAVQTVRSPETTAVCPAGTGVAEGVVPLLMRVDGDQTVGAISTFELTDGGAPTLRMRIGGASYAFDDVAITVAQPATSGTFSASADGLTVDGAFLCT